MKNKNLSNKSVPALNANKRFRNKTVKTEFSKNQINQVSISHPPMTEQLVVPPSRVWNKIESILDKQEQAKASANVATVFTLATAIKAGKKKHPMYFTTFGLAVLLCFFLIAF